MDVVMILPKKSAKNRRESTGICRIKISFSMFQCKNYKKYLPLYLPFTFRVRGQLIKNISVVKFVEISKVEER